MLDTTTTFLTPAAFAASICSFWPSQSTCSGSTWLLGGVSSSSCACAIAAANRRSVIVWSLQRLVIRTRQPLPRHGPTCSGV
jgi:hypothetical protein